MLNLPAYFIGDNETEGAIEKWHKLRSSTKVNADNLAFCADMYLCFDNPNCIFGWLSGGQGALPTRKVLRELRQGYERFIERFGYSWGDYK